MGLGFHELNPDFQQIFKNYAQDLYDIKESIWEVEFYGNGSGLYATLGGYVGGNNGIRNSTDTNNSIGYTYDYINATQYAYKVYKDGDLRRDFTIAPFKYNWGTKVEEGQEVPKTYWKARSFSTATAANSAVSSRPCCPNTEATHRPTFRCCAMPMYC